MPGQDARDYLRVARSHRGRVRVARSEPTDWTELCLYSFFALEAAVMAAAAGRAWDVRRDHAAKAAAVCAAIAGLPSRRQRADDGRQHVSTQLGAAEVGRAKK